MLSPYIGVDEEEEGRDESLHVHDCNIFVRFPVFVLEGGEFADEMEDGAYDDGHPMRFCGS